MVVLWFCGGCFMAVWWLFGGCFLGFGGCLVYVWWLFDGCSVVVLEVCGGCLVVA